MDRRRFIRNISMAGAGGFVLGGVPLNILAGNAHLNAMLAAGSNDHVMIFIQLHGGNDGLNTILPISQYNDYYTLRPNIALPQQGNRKIIELDNNLTEEMKVGVHPDMIAFKQMYEENRASVVLNVGYDAMNLSHFRGRDILFMGGDASDYYNSGWMGRFLDTEYPGYPDSYPNDNMPDPIGIELGNSASIAFHRENGIPIGMAIDDPDNFYKLITGVGVDPPIAFPDSHAGEEYRFLTQMEAKSNQYAGRLKEIYDKGKNTASVVYPDLYPYNAPERFLHNSLTSQMKLVARLLSGGIKTRIFLCRIGGFDTHSNQVESYDTSMGAHGALLYHLTSAVKAFYDDLKSQALDSKVLSLTFTEFGRRAYSNASYGTDHGTAFPVLLFGPSLKGGVEGTHPDLKNLDNGNLRYSVDYRRLYTTLLSNWLGASDETLTKVGFGDYTNQKLDLLTGDKRMIHDTFSGMQIYPNPARETVYVRFNVLKQGKYEVKISSTSGKTIFLHHRTLGTGSQVLSFNLDQVKKGFYLVTLTDENGLNQTNKLQVL